MRIKNMNKRDALKERVTLTPASHLLQRCKMNYILLFYYCLNYIFTVMKSFILFSIIKSSFCRISCCVNCYFRPKSPQIIFQVCGVQTYRSLMFETTNVDVFIVFFRFNLIKQMCKCLK